MSSESLKVFRSAYPRGRNFVVSPGVDAPYDRSLGGVKVRMLSCRDLAHEMAGATK